MRDEVPTLAAWRDDRDDPGRTLAEVAAEVAERLPGAAGDDYPKLG